MDGYRYVLKQWTPEGLWTSPEIFVGEAHHVRQNVIAGYLSGQPRWAETSDDSPNPGFFLYGIDRSGKPHETGTGCPDFD